MKNFDSIKFKMAVRGHHSLSHGRYLVNCARWLDHYYKTKCNSSGEDAPWKFLDLIEFKLAKPCQIGRPILG